MGGGVEGGGRDRIEFVPGNNTAPQGAVLLQSAAAPELRPATPRSKPRSQFLHQGRLGNVHQSSGIVSTPSFRSGLLLVSVRNRD